MVKLQKGMLNKCQSKAEETELRQSYASAHLMREKLSQVLSDKAEEAQRASLAKEGYESAAWAYKQADNVGYQRAIQEILKYLW